MGHRTLKPMTGTTLEARRKCWEGSAKGIAYSERNHHVAGLLVLFMGVAELSHVVAPVLPGMGQVPPAVDFGSRRLVHHRLERSRSLADRLAHFR